MMLRMTLILIMTVAGGFFMDRNKMSKKGYKTLISGAWRAYF